MYRQAPEQVREFHRRPASPDQCETAGAGWCEPRQVQELQRRPASLLHYGYRVKLLYVKGARHLYLSVRTLRYYRATGRIAISSHALAGAAGGAASHHRLVLEIG